MKRNYNLKALMSKAWNIYRKAAKKAAITFSEALKRAWKWAKVQASNAARIEAAIAENGIIEEVHSWAGWQALGRMVIHGEKAIMQVVVDTPENGDGKTYRKSFFTYSQTQVAPIAA